MTSRPLLQIADGADQDQRSDLYLAYRRCAQWRKVTQSNLHVRELLFWVMACDRDGRGVQKSYEEIADRLELTSGRAARAVVDRAATDFGLLIVHEARYQRGGQAANRYSINWPLVRAIRDGLEDGNPWPKQRPEPEQTTQRAGDLTGQAGVTTGQAGVTTGHPYKEYSRTITRTDNYSSNTTHSASATGSAHAPPPEPDERPPTPSEPENDPPWQVVVSELVGLGVSDRGAAAAIQEAQARGCTPSDCLELVATYRARHPRTPGMTPGWLVRWIRGQSAPEPEPASGPRGGGLPAAEVSRLALRAAIVKAGRRAGVDDTAIAQRCQLAGVQF